MDRKIKAKREERERKKNQRKSHPVRKGLLIILLVILLLLGAAAGVTIHMLNKMNRVDPGDVTPIDRKDEYFDPDTGDDDTMNPEEIGWGGVKIVSSPYVKNILLIGQDRRPGEGRARSDSMIIVSINTKTGVISLVSLMRDMYVPIPEYSDNRINAAYAFGGMALLDEVIKQDFGLVIDGNIEVDFEQFVQVMSLIAPLDIDLKSYEVDYLNRGTNWGLHVGVNALSAEQLLRYSRIRMVGNADYERTERQRRVVGVAINKLKEESLTRIFSLVDKAMPVLTTDMSNADIISLATTVMAKKPVIGGNYRLPFGNTYTNEIIRGMMVLVPDLKANSEKIQEYLYGDLMKENKK
jgi:LCP family protein required for cell wall assembly